MKTIAQQINWDFKTNGDLEIKDKKGTQIYYENSNGVWVKKEYDSRGNEIYYENSDGYWEKKEYDSQGNQIYFEDSNGLITDKRPKPCENKIVEIACEDKVVEIDGKKFKLVRVSD